LPFPYTFPFYFDDLISDLSSQIVVSRLGEVDLSSVLTLRWVAFTAFEWLAGSIKIPLYIDIADLAGLLNVRFAFSELAGLLGIKYLHTDLLASLYLRPPYAPLDGLVVVRRMRWSSLWSLLRIGTKPLFGNLLIRRVDVKALKGELNIMVFDELLSKTTIAQFDSSDISSSLIVQWFRAISTLSGNFYTKALGYSDLTAKVFVPRYLGALGIRGLLYVPWYQDSKDLQSYLSIRFIEAIEKLQFLPKAATIELLLLKIKIELEKLKWMIEFQKEGLG